jgi:multidrug efflux pump subunit AcrA (membrane-fusion protein)
MTTIKIQRWLSLLVILAVLLAACSNFGQPPTPTPAPVENPNATPVVSATGKVMPARWTRLSMKMPGVVEEVLVEEGQAIKKGDILVRLEGVEDLNAATAAARAEIAASEKGLSDLDKGARDAATLTLQMVAQLEKQVRDARYQLDNYTPPSNQAKMATEEALTWAKQQLDEAWKAFQPYRYYPENDEQRKEAKEDYDEAQADYNAAVKRLQYENELAVAEKNLQQAREDFAIYQQGPDPKDVAVAQARLDNAKAALQAAEARLDDLVLTAPFDGIVSEVNVRVGEAASPQTPPIILLADLNHLQVETTDLNEIDAARVAVGAVVSVTFDALPGVVVQGVVHSLAPKASEGSGVNYTAVILLEEQPEALRWGMTAFADIEVK